MTSKSEITPSLSGRTATMLAGVRPTICFASAPTASTRWVFGFIATTDGSLMTMPLPRTSTSVLAVPRSMPMSRENRPSRAFSGFQDIGGALPAAPVSPKPQTMLLQAHEPRRSHSQL